MTSSETLNNRVPLLRVSLHIFLLAVCPQYARTDDSLPSTEFANRNITAINVSAHDEEKL
jgi:hypothetical protein